MRYDSTAGLDAKQLTELISRVWQIAAGRGETSGRPGLLNICEQVVVTLVLLRQNVNKMTIADMFGAGTGDMNTPNYRSVATTSCNDQLQRPYDSARRLAYPRGISRLGPAGNGDREGSSVRAWSGVCFDGADARMAG